MQHDAEPAVPEVDIDGELGEALQNANAGSLRKQVAQDLLEIAELRERIGKAEAEAAQLREQLAVCDRLAEAGLCQFSLGGARAFLNDIRGQIAKTGIQGGLTTPTKGATQ
jgi:uncharacterized protein involved in exopolysaccharide biosynthesis